MLHHKHILLSKFSCYLEASTDEKTGKYDEKTVGYIEWAKTHKELAELGNKIWDAETLEDVEKAFNEL